MQGSGNLDEPHVFVSYASADRERVLQVVAELRNAGIACWIDQHGVEGGANWGRRIAEAIEGCAAFLLMSSAASLASRNVRQEIALAWKYDRPYLPLRLDPTPAPKEIEYWLETAQWIELLDQPSAVWLPRVQRALDKLSFASPAGSRAAQPPVEASSRSLLPTPLSSFVGREREVMEVAGLLQSERIVTLTGPGGIGKTRVAIAVGHRIGETFHDGVAFIDLAPLRDPALVLPRIAAALDMRESGGQAPLDLVTGLLRTRQLLLMLDNVEQVIAAAAQLSALVAHCPTLTLLVTSREALRIAGEREYAIAPLPTPAQQHPTGLDELRENPTVALFLQRARAANAGFSLTADNAATVAAICRRLDGLPLAMELAAARSRVLTPRQILDRLSDPLRFLTGGARDLPDRQRTMRDTISWSYELLPPNEQRLLRQLSVFDGGWTLESAEAVLGPGGEPPAFAGAAEDGDILDTLISLIEKSLIEQREASDATPDANSPRFDMLGTIREFGSERLAHEGEADAARDRHAAWFLSLAQQFQAAYYVEDQAAWFNRLERERDNLRAAFDTLLGQNEVGAAGMLFTALRNFWWNRGPFSEAQRWFDALYPRLPEAPEQVRGYALNDAGLLASARRDLERARAYHAESLSIFERLGIRDGVSVAVFGMSRVDLFSGDLPAARATTARALALFRELGDRMGVCSSLVDLAMTHLGSGDAEQAHALLSEALSIAREDEHQAMQIVCLAQLGVTAWEQGHVPEAANRWREALRLNAGIRELEHCAECLEGLAMVAASDGQAERASRLAGASDAIRERLPFPRVGQVAKRFERALAPARASLGAEPFSAALRAGRALPLDDAVACALEETQARSNDAP